MIGIDAGVVVLVIVLVVGYLITKGAKDVAKVTHKPDGELAKAMRLLDKIVAYDEGVSALPITLRDEAKKMTDSYFKENS